MSKKTRKRRAHPDDEEADANGFDSDDDFDPRELLAVKQIANKRKAIASAPPQRGATKRTAARATTSHSANGATNGSIHSNDAENAAEDEAEGDEQDHERKDEDAMGEHDEDGADEDGDADGVDTVTQTELSRLQRSKKPQREQKAFINNKVDRHSRGPPTPPVTRFPRSQRPLVLPRCALSRPG